MNVLRRLRRHPLRNALTLLQIGLGALAATLALSAYLGAYNRQLQAEPERFDLVAGYVEEDGSSGTWGVMDSESTVGLLALTPDVKAVSLYASAWNPTFSVGEKLYQFQTAAYVDKAYFDMNDVALSRGTVFSEREAANAEDVLLLSDEAASVMFGDADPLGQDIILQPDANFGDEAGPARAFRVIGTFAVNEASKAQNQETEHLFMPIWSQGEMFGNSDTLSVLAGPGQGEAAREQILSAARQTYGEILSDWGTEEGQDFYIREMNERSFISADLIDPTVVMFGLFGAVALVVAAIGIFSVTVVEAVERERDLGVRRALGATRAQVTGEAVLETALLAGLSGLAGAALAAAIIPVLTGQVGHSLFWSVDLRWQPTAAFGVTALSFALGALLSAFPSWQAARVCITKALKVG